MLADYPDLSPLSSMEHRREVAERLTRDLAASPHDVAQVSRALVQSVVDAFGGRAAVVLVESDDRSDLPDVLNDDPDLAALARRHLRESVPGDGSGSPARSARELPTVVAEPLIAHGRTIGYLAAAGKDEQDQLDQDAVECIQDLAKRAAFALDSALRIRHADRIEARLGAILETAADAILVVDDRGRIESVNAAGVRMFGWSIDELVGRPAAVLMPGDVGADHRRHMDRYMDTGEAHVIGRSRVVEAVRKDGSHFPIEISVNDVQLEERRFFTAIIRDVTERHVAQRRLEHLARLDELTGLANRSQAIRTLEQVIASAADAGLGFALLFLDIDQFKGVNDRFGHAEGDQVLRSAARRIASSIRRHDLACRWGGDEFLVVAGASNDPDGDGRAIGSRIAAAFAPPFEVGGSHVTLGVSIGMAMFPHDSTDLDELISAADDAMYGAKSTARRDSPPARSRSVHPLTGDPGLGDRRRTPPSADGIEIG